MPLGSPGLHHIVVHGLPGEGGAIRLRQKGGEDGVQGLRLTDQAVAEHIAEVIVAVADAYGIEQLPLPQPPAGLGRARGHIHHQHDAADGRQRRQQVIVKFLRGAEEQEGAVGMPGQERQHLSDAALGVDKPGAYPHGLAFLQQAAVTVHVLRRRLRVHIQLQRPGDAEMLPCLDVADFFRSQGAAVVPQRHAEGQQTVVLHVSGGVLDQGIEGAALVAEHMLCALEEPLLKMPLAEIHRHVHQIPAAPPGMGLDLPQGSADNGLNQHIGYALGHCTTSLPVCRMRHATLEFPNISKA